MRATTHLGELVDVDLVIESVVEDLAVKQDLFRELDSVCKPDTILATNTSTLPVIEMAMATGRPDLVCGVHFFNPAPAMSLVEVVRPITASDATIRRSPAFSDRVGKEPVEVKDQAGFIVNALLFPYLNNAVRLLEQGMASKEGIDAAMKGGCGFPMGPSRCSTWWAWTRRWPFWTPSTRSTDDPNYAAVPLLRRLVTAGTARSQDQAGVLRLQALTSPEQPGPVPPEGPRPTGAAPPYRSGPALPERPRPTGAARSSTVTSSLTGRSGPDVDPPDPGRRRTGRRWGPKKAGRMVGAGNWPPTMTSVRPSASMSDW